MEETSNLVVCMLVVLTKIKLECFIRSTQATMPHDVLSLAFFTSVSKIILSFIRVTIWVCQDKCGE